MRRLFALMLIVTSGWLLYRTVNIQLGGFDHLLSRQIASHMEDPSFMFPAIGSFMCLLGGLTVFFAGPGGALIALAGGLGVAGFTVSLDKTVDMDLSHFWDNQLAVGVVMLMLAAMTATISRRPPREAISDTESNRAPNRRVF